MTWSWLAIAAAGLCAGVSAGGGMYLMLRRSQAAARRALALRLATRQHTEKESVQLETPDAIASSVQRMRHLTVRLSTGAAVALAPWVRERRAARTRTGSYFCKHARMAGCEQIISPEAFCETCFRYALVGGASGALVGVAISNAMAVLLGCAGALIGYGLPLYAVRQLQTMRGLDAGRHLSEMLEVVALGLRSGLTFDRSFALYGEHFDSSFAQSCAAVYRRWSLGLSTREEALRLLAGSYACDQLERIVESIIRSLKLGSALAGPLEEFAEQARLTYRTELEERVAKAPVKMMLPTGTLILPAMLLLVMGPILLELTQGF